MMIFLSEAAEMRFEPSSEKAIDVTISVWATIDFSTADTTKS